MVKVFTAFSGYDSQCLALNRANIDYELVGWSEIDKFAIQAHNALFPQWTDRNYGDISKIDWNLVPDFDLFTYSSPCQDFSNAGKMQGGEIGSGTRSSLLWECEKAIRAKMPKYLLMENVANLVSKKFIGTFQNWLNILSKLGYTNYWKVLNAKDYGVPQNRKRVFVVSILNSQQPYYFPKAIETNLRVKDILEGYVDESYYLSDKYLDTFHKTGRVWKGMSGVVGNIKKLAHTITTNKGDGLKIAVIYQQQLEPRTDGCSNTLTTVQKDNLIIEPDKVVAALRGREQVVLGWTRDSKGNVVNRHPVEISNTITSAKRDNTQNYVVEPTTIQRGHGYNQGGEFKDVTPTITGSTWHFNNVLKLGYRIRKYTERECFRLMGVADEDSDKIRQVVSKTQCYKLAGNSIVVDVLVAIFNQLFSENKTTDKQLKLF
jgi:DNA (cytosine-5)-methyltransferase 1